MLESLVANILNRFLKNYVSNLNYDQLKIGMWKGEVNLRNLKLRRDALDKLDLPINVSEGYLGELTLVIPWSNLRTEPVKVIIDHVYLLVEPKNEATVTVEEEEERAQELKRRRLSTAEMLESSDVQTEQKNDKSGDGFISQLTTKIVDNLQFTMKNIHIRYEDNISDPGHPFSTGITLKELSALSTDNEWNPKFITESTRTINKLTTLESLSIYWNTDSRSLAGMHHEEAAQVYTDLIPTASNFPREHQYILKPVSGTGKIRINKDYGKDIPKTDIIMIFDELAFGLDDHQYRDAILMVDLFHANLKKQKYLKFHPGKGKTAKSNPKEFLQFAGKAILSEVHEKKYKWSWDHFKTRRDQRLKYVECYVADKMKTASPDQLKTLEKLEHDLKFEDIRFYRSIAKTNLRREKVKIDKKIEKKKAEDAKVGWWGWLSGSAPAANKDEDVDEDDDSGSIHMTEEQKNELYNAIEFDEDKMNIASSIDIPKDTIKFALKTKLNRGSFTLKQNVKKPTETDLLSVVFDAVSVDVTQYVESMKVGAALGDLQLFDGSTKNTIYHQLIGVKNGSNRASSLLDIKYNLSEKERRKSLATVDMIDSQDSKPFFSFVFEKKPLSKVADNAFSLKMRHLEIIYSPQVIAGVIKFFKPPKSKMESVNALMAVAGDTLEVIKAQSRAGLEFALETHTTFDLNVDMDAPIIIIPESLTSQESPVMIIDAGHINIDSQLADPKVVNDIKTKDIKNYTSQDVETLGHLMYDRFNLSLSQTKVLIGTNTKECLWQLQDNPPRNGVDARFIERIDMNFLIEMCILPGKTEFTKFKISGHLPLLSVNLSDSKYKILMKIVDFIVPTDGDEKSKIAQPTKGPQMVNANQNSSNYIMTERLWGAPEADYILPDTASENTVDIPSSPTPTPSVIAKTEIAKTDIQEFKLTFKVDKVSVNLHEAINALQETLLCEILLEKFELNVITRPLDLMVEVSLNALTVIDKMDVGGDFPNLVSSEIINRTDQVDAESNEKNLVFIRYQKVAQTHPLFDELYEGFDQNVNVLLSTLTVTVTRKSLLRIYNWIMNTFTAPPTPKEIETGEELYEGDVFYNDDDSSIAYRSEDSENVRDTDQIIEIANPVKPNTTRMKVVIKLDSVNLILNNDGLRLGTGELSYGELEILLEPKTILVRGKFGNFTLSDDTVTSSNSKVYLVSILDEELFSFVYQTFDSKSFDFPGYNQNFDLKMGAIQLFVTESVNPTLKFLSEFLEMKNVYDAARIAAVETAQQYKEGGNRFQFNIMISSPILIFPVRENNNTETLVAHLGEIRASNKFEMKSRRDLSNIPNSIDIPVAHINCGLYDISLRSTHSIYGTDSDSVERHFPIIDDVNIIFDIESPEDSKNSIGPASKIEGKISDVRMALTEKQYKLILKTWEFIQKTFLGSGEEDNVKKEDSNQVAPRLDKVSTGSSSQSNQSTKTTDTEVQKKRATSDKSTIALDLIITLDTVSLDIMAGESLNSKERTNEMLSRLSFDGICLKLQNMSDASMLLEVSMQSINFADTRVQSQSKFREILPANTLDGPQFQVRLSSFKDGLTPTMDIHVTVDSPKIVLSLDYLFLLKDFFMSPFVVVEPTEAQKFVQSHSNIPDTKQNDLKQLQSQDKLPASVLKYNVNIVDLQVICLAAPENSASEAVILSFNQLTIIQKVHLEIHLDGIGMVLCRMDTIEESTMHLVEEFSVLLKMETSSTNSVHNLMLIKLEVQPIILRLSYQDAMLIMTVVNKVMALMGNNEKTEAPKPLASDDNSDISGLLVANPATTTEPDNTTESENVPEAKKGIEPFIIMSKESLNASFEGIQIVLIEDLHVLPFIDIQVNPFAITASDWTRAIHAEVDFVLKANNFNFKNSHWEPILEPWNFCIKMVQDPTDKSTNVSLQSKDLLYLNVTHAFLESLLTVSETLSESRELSRTAPDQVKPYLFRNFTGSEIHLWNMSSDVEIQDAIVHKIEHGQILPWTFRDWKKRRETTQVGKNLVGIQVMDHQWESIVHISLDKEGDLAYRLKPEVGGINHRLIVDIHLENHVKTVTFRSGLVLENTSDNDIQVAAVKTDRETLNIVHIDPHQVYHVPIDLCYSRWIVVRPSEEYNWSKEMFMWSDVLLPNFPKCVECPPKEGNTANKMSYKVQVHAEYDKKNPLVREYPFMKIQFCPPIEVENLLPFDFYLTLRNEITGESVSTTIETGKTAQLYNMKSNSALAIQLDLKSDRYKCSETAIIRTTPNYNSMGEKLVITDHENVPANLRMHITRSSNTTDSLHISIYAPYLIFNKSGLPISLRPRHTYRQGHYPVESIPAYAEGERIIPTIYSYTDYDRHNRSQISINDSKWSDPISFEAVGNSQDVTLFSKTDAYARHAGINVEEGFGLLRLTKIVTIAPRYILKNNMSVPLKFCEFGSTDVTNINPNQKMPLYQTTKSNVRWLCLQLQDIEDNWSSPFDIQEIGKTYLKVDKGDKTTPHLVRVSIHIQESTIFVTFNEDDDWPYIIVNNSSVDINFRQENLEIEEYDLKSSQKHAFREPRLFTLHPGDRIKYSWDIPVAKEKRLELLVGNRHRSINFQAIGSQVPFRYLKQRDGPMGSNTLSINIVADDSALVLRLTDFDSSKSLFRPKSSGTSTLASTSREGSLRDTFETVNIQHVTNYVLELNLAGIGVSVINKDAAEIVFATVKGFDFKYTDSNMYQSLRLSIQWLQIDNQLFSSTYPILCYPSTLPKESSELSTHPTLHVALDKVKDDCHGVLYFKLFSILLQEMTFELDEDFLYALIDFAQFQNVSNKPQLQEDMFIMKLAEPDVDKAEALYYFEEFCIQPMRLNLSFVRTDKIDDKESSDTARTSPLGYVFNVFTMTLGNINDAPIKLNALIVENLRASSEDLTSRIILHYREQVVYQIHRVLGSIDILGNPVGLFNTLSSGFGELFYEPYQGFIMSDRPQDLGIGIAKGLGGFMKKGVFGITDSMSKFTGSLGKGISAATMDKKFQDRRRMNMTRNKPTHAIYGVTQGVGYFGTSIASGVVGLVKRPIEGAESGGVVGFVGGVGKGIVGVFTKPVVGFFDMASNVTAGIRETTTVFEAGQLTRERVPRYTGKDGIITTYSQREALGQMWLKEMENAKYFSEVYIAHTIVGQDATVAILTFTRIMIVRSDGLKLDYAIHLDTIEDITTGIDGIYVKLKKPTTRVLSIEEPTSSEWFATIIKRTLEQRKEERDRQ